MQLEEQKDKRSSCLRNSAKPAISANDLSVPGAYLRMIRRVHCRSSHFSTRRAQFAAQSEPGKVPWERYREYSDVPVAIKFMKRT